MVQRTNAARGGRASVSVMKGEVVSSILTGSTTFAAESALPEAKIATVRKAALIRISKLYDYAMGRDPTERGTPDLFSTNVVRDASPSPTKPIAAAEPVNKPSQRHILPKNLRHAVKQLSDGELDDLFEVVFDEAKRRGRLPRNVETDLALSSRRPSELATKPTPSTDKRRKMDIAEVSLTQGQVNAVRAAFKAGVTLSRIARQFGISQSDVRKALASDPSR